MMFISYTHNKEDSFQCSRTIVPCVDSFPGMLLINLSLADFTRHYWVGYHNTNKPPV